MTKSASDNLRPENLRIISLIASATEIVHALGLGQFQVGRSHECDYPAEIMNLPQCTSFKFKADGSSYEIDQRVKAIVQEGLSVYKVDSDVLRSLAPTHIITQDQCQVCAVSFNDVQEACFQLIESKPEVISLRPNCLEDIWSDIYKVASGLGFEQRAENLVAQLKARLEEISLECMSSSSRPRVACIEWIEPLLAAGNWMPELVEIASGINLFGEAGKHSPWMSFEELVMSNPDIIIVSPCGFDLERTLSEMYILEKQPAWADLSAVKSGRVYIADGNQYFNRPGPRVIEALEIMAEILHPDICLYGHEGRGFLSLESSTT